MSANLIIGTSHAIQFSSAIGTTSATAADARNKLVKIDSLAANENYLLYVTPGPDFIRLSNDTAGAISATFESPIETIRTFNDEGSKVIFCVGGNEHNVTLFLRRKAYDFHWPPLPSHDPSYQRIPVPEMRSVINGAISRSLLTTRLLAQELPRAQKFLLAAPPPIPSEAHIRKYPEIFDLEKDAVEDPITRLKIYFLYIQIVEAFAREHGLTFIPAPKEAVDDLGFLKEEYWEGCTHATARYYDGVVNELNL